MYSKHSSLPSSEIFSMSADGYWFASVFCTQMMLCHVQNGMDTKPVQQGNLEMSLSVWHDHVLRPAAKYVTENHEIPSFAQKAIDTHRSYGQRNVAIALHISLLVHASKEILEQCTEQNVGPNTMKEVKKWFELMAETADSSLYRQAPARLKAEMEKVQRAHTLGIKNIHSSPMKFYSFGLPT